MYVFIVKAAERSLSRVLNSCKNNKIGQKNSTIELFCVIFSMMNLGSKWTTRLTRKSTTKYVCLSPNHTNICGKMGQYD